MAVAYDTHNSTVETGVVTTIDTVITPSSGTSNAALYAFHFTARAARDSLSVVFDPAGVNRSFTQIASGSSVLGLDYGCAIYRLLDTDIVKGSAVTIRGTSTGGTARATLFVVALTGVDQSTPEGTIVTNSTTDTTHSATVTSDTDGLVLDFIMRLTGEPTADASQTGRGGPHLTNSTWSAVSQKAGASSVTMTWTGVDSRIADLYAVPVNAAGGGGGSNYDLGDVGSYSTSFSGVDALSISAALGDVGSTSESISGADALSISFGLASTDSQSPSFSNSDALSVGFGLSDIGSISEPVSSSNGLSCSFALVDVGSVSQSFSHPSNLTLAGSAIDLDNVDSVSASFSEASALGVGFALGNADSFSASFSDAPALTASFGLGDIGSVNDNRSSADALSIRAQLANVDSVSASFSHASNVTVGGEQSAAFMYYYLG